MNLKCYFQLALKPHLSLEVTMSLMYAPRKLLEPLLLPLLTPPPTPHAAAADNLNTTTITTTRY